LSVVPTVRVENAIFTTFLVLLATNRNPARPTRP